MDKTMKFPPASPRLIKYAWACKVISDSFTTIRDLNGVFRETPSKKEQDEAWDFVGRPEDDDYD